EQAATAQQSSPAASQSAAAPNAGATNPTPAPGTSPATASTTKVDACTLLTSDEVKAVQGEPVKERKPSERVSGDFIVTQCYYELPTTSNSISLTLTANNPGLKGQSVNEYW